MMTCKNMSPRMSFSLFVQSDPKDVTSSPLAAPQRLWLSACLMYTKRLMSECTTTEFVLYPDDRMGWQQQQHLCLDVPKKSKVSTDSWDRGSSVGSFLPVKLLKSRQSTLVSVPQDVLQVTTSDCEKATRCRDSRFSAHLLPLWAWCLGVFIF